MITTERAKEIIQRMNEISTKKVAIWSMLFGPFSIPDHDMILKYVHEYRALEVELRALDVEFNEYGQYRGLPIGDQHGQRNCGVDDPDQRDGVR